MRKFNEPIHIIGLGSTGSYIALHLAKKGVESFGEVHGWDGDVVDLGNCRSQTYNSRHVGLLKTNALAQQMREWGDVKMVGHSDFVDSPQLFSGVVFLCVDTMKGRHDIWMQSIKNNPCVTLMIEMRLETTHSLIHVVDPRNPEHVRMWERYWYPDDEATTTGSCGAATSLGPIADITANICVWQFIRAVEIADGAEDVLDNQIRVNMRPFTIETFQW